MTQRKREKNERGREREIEREVEKEREMKSCVSFNGFTKSAVGNLSFPSLKIKLQTIGRPLLHNVKKIQNLIRY